MVPKSEHQPELKNSDAPGGQPNSSCASQPARRLQRAAQKAPAEQTAAQTQQPESPAGSSSLLAPVTDLSASEAAAGLPPIHRPRTRSEHRTSIEHGKNPSADADAAATGSARRPPVRRRTRQNASEDGLAEPLQPDADDSNTNGSLKQSVAAAPKRRRLAAEGECPPGTAEMARPDTLEEFASMPTKDQPKKPRARVQRLGELCGRSQDVLELADVGDRDQRTQIQQAAAAIDVIEPGPASAGVALAPAVAGIEVALVTAGLASASAADQIEDASMLDRREVLQIEESQDDVMLISSQEDLVDLLDSSQQEDDIFAAVPEEPETAPHELFFSCAICLEEHSMEDCYIARMCGHRMCRDAAREVVLGAVRGCSFPVLCPICQAKSEPKCIPCSRREATLAAAQEAGREDIPSGPSAWCCTLDADIPLLLSVEEEEQYLERSLKAAANSCADLIPCPKPNCKGVAVTGQEDESPALKCNACEHEWCGKCNVDWHSNKTCEDYQLVLGQKVAEEGLEEYQKNNRIVKCPICNHGIEKTIGCDHMTCSRCKTPFCWRCGQKRTAQHDTKCPSAAGRAYAAGLGAPASRGPAYGGLAYGGFAYGAPAHGGPAQGLPTVPAPLQLAQPRAPWAWPPPQPGFLQQPGPPPLLPDGVSATPAAAPPRARPPPGGLKAYQVFLKMRADRGGR